MTAIKIIKYFVCSFFIITNSFNLNSKKTRGFFISHKTLDCIRSFFGVGSVDGVIKADEVFFAESFKDTKPTKMPRKSRKRGKQVKKRKHQEGIYHIQHINAVHSKFKKWMNRFNGVTTKYINNYMYWFKWPQLFETHKEIVKIKNFMVQCNVANAYTKIPNFKETEPVFV